MIKKHSLKLLYFVALFMCAFSFEAGAASFIFDPSIDGTIFNATEDSAFVYDANVTVSELLITFSDNSDAPEINFAVFYINGSNGIINFTPLNGDAGMSPWITVIAENKSNPVDKRIATIRFNITNTNDAPVIDSYFPLNSNQSVMENSSLYFNATASDVDSGDVFNYSWWLDGAQKNTTWNWTYYPGFCDAGNHNVTVVVNDSSNAQSSRYWNVTVNNSNRAPVFNRTISNITWQEDNNRLNNLTLSDYFYDLDYDQCGGANNDTLRYTVAGNSSITIIINSTTFNVSFYPAANWSGVEYITITLNDSYNITNSNNITLNVTNVNDPPSLALIPNQTLYINIPFSLQINATDPDNDTLVYYDNTTLFNINSSGAINFTANELQIGNYSVNITVGDGVLNASQAVMFYVFNNSAPVLSSIGSLNATAGRVFILYINASDADIDNLTFYDNTTLFNITTWNNTIATGLLNFTPTEQDNGNYSIRISVNDTKGAVDYEDIIFTVVLNNAPNITLNSPANSSFITLNWTLLNATVFDFDNDNMTAYFYAGNNSNGLNSSEGLVYIGQNVVNGSVVTYNLTALPIKPGDPSLVLLYHFDNRSEFGENYNNSNGSIIYDFSSAKNNGTVYSGADNGISYNYSGGKFAGAFRFDGIDDYINMTVPQNKTSWEYWAKNASGDNLWHHYANSSGIEYVDGIAGAGSFLKLYYLEGNSTYLGKTSLSSFFNGTIDEFAVWNKTLTAAEVLSHYKLSETKYYWKANASDWSKSNESGAYEFTVDITTPNITLLNQPVNGSNISASAIQFNFTAVDSNPRSAILYINGAANATLSSWASGAKNSFNAISLSDGYYNWTVWVNDSAGNTYLYPDNYTLFIDATIPKISYERGTSNASAFYSQNWIYVNVSVNETNFRNITFYLYNTSGLVNSTGYTSQTYSLNFTSLNEGNYSINATVYDIIGNVNSTPTRAAIILDRTSPAWSNNRTNNTIPGANITVQFNITWNDSFSLSSYKFSWDNSGVWVNISNAAISGTSYNAVENLTVTASAGTAVNYKWYANDSAGNWNETASWSLAVGNNRAPNITYYYPNSTNASVKENSSLQFNATASDADGDAIAYNWTLDGAMQSNSSEWLYQPNFTAAGNHNVTIFVSDGITTISRYWNITVNNTNRAPKFGIITHTTQADFSGGINNNTNSTRQGGNVTLAMLNSTHYRSAGNFTSSAIRLPIDTVNSNFSFGSINWVKTEPANSSILFSIRTSPDNSTWANWSAYTNQSGQQIQNASGRYIQYFAEFSTNDTTKTPALEEVTVTHSIPNFIGNEDSTYNLWIDLDDYFSDDDGEAISYNVTPNSNVGITIDSQNRVSLSPSSDWYGTIYVSFTANDSEYNSTSNNVTITFNDVSEPSNIIVVSGGGGGGGTSTIITTKTKLINITELVTIELIVPKPISVYSNDTIIAPILIKNTGNATLKGIDLSALADSPDMLLSLSKNYIEKLGANEQEEAEISIKFKNVTGSHSIFVNAKVKEPKINDSAVFQINILENFSSRIIFVRDFLNVHPECLELTEAIQKAQSAMNNKQYDQANSLLESAIDGCKYLISSSEKIIEKPEMPERRIVKKIFANKELASTIIFIILITIVLIFYIRYNIKRDI